MNVARARTVLAEALQVLVDLDEAQQRLADADQQRAEIEQRTTDASLRLQPIEEEHRKKTIEAAEAVRDRDRAREELASLRQQIEVAQGELARVDAIREQAVRRLTDPLPA